MSDYEIVCSTVDRAEWLKARRTGIGASDAGAILGVSPYASPVSIYADKLGVGDEDRDDERKKWGRLLEPTIINEFEETSGRTVYAMDVLMRSKEWPFLMATLDAKQLSREFEGYGICEVKNTTQYWDGTPDHIWIQAQHQMAVTGYTWGSVVALYCGSQLRVIDLERDDKFIRETLVPECEAFWGRVQSGAPPPTDNSNATKAALARLFPGDDGQTIAIEDGELATLDRELLEIKERQKKLDSKRTGIENRLRMAIGEASAGVLPSGAKYTLKANARGVRTLRRVGG